MVADCLPTAEKQQAKRRWYQYRLRSLFLLTLLVAIGMSWLTVTMRNQRQQKAAAEEIEKAGGEVKTEVTWLGKLLRDNSLVKVTDVQLSGESTTDAAIADLRELSQLQGLLLYNTQVTDAALVHLRDMRQLQRLGVYSEKVTDAGLVHLEGLRQLQVLLLYTPQVTDAGLLHLKKLTQLQTLGLVGMTLSDTGLANLHGLTGLQVLWLTRTTVSNDGRSKFQHALPNCKIQDYE